MAEIKITFPVSRAVMYPAILRLAEQFDKAFTPAEDESKINAVVIDSNAINDQLLKKIRKLWSLTKPIKNSTFTIDGEKTFLFEGNVGSILSCMKSHDYAEDQQAYCNGTEGKPSHTFGCRELDGISSHHEVPNAMIFTQSFVSDDVKSILDPDGKAWKNAPKPMPFSLFAKKTDKGWVVDAAKIKAKARDLAKGKSCQMCPHFSWARVDQAIDLKCVTAPTLFSTMTEHEIFGLDSSYD